MKIEGCVRPIFGRGIFPEGKISPWNASQTELMRTHSIGIVYSQILFSVRWFWWFAPTAGFVVV